MDFNHVYYQTCLIVTILMNLDDYFKVIDVNYYREEIVDNVTEMYLPSNAWK